MEKSLKVMQVIKKLLTIFSPLFLLIGSGILIINQYTNVSIKTPLKLLNIFSILLLIFAVINITYSVLTLILNKKQKMVNENNDNSQDLISKNAFINKAYNFLVKNENIISIVLNCVLIIVSIYSFSLLFSSKGNYYFNVFYRLMYVQWGIVLFSIFKILVSKEKKAFIINLIFTLIALLFTIIMSVFAFTMMYGKIGVYTNIVEYSIFLMIFSICSLFMLGFISTNGSFKKFNATTNFGLGFLGFLLSLILFNSKNIIQKLVSSYGYIEFDGLSIINIGNIAAHIAVSVIIVLCFVNIFINIKKFIKNKNILGLIDIALSIVSLVLAIIGLYELTKYFLYIQV